MIFCLGEEIINDSQLFLFLNFNLLCIFIYYFLFFYLLLFFCFFFMEGGVGFSLG